jgi:hypothetical protein
LDDLTDDNSYKIAIDFNKKMINELEENSQLFIPFIQLDSYILYNYKKNSYSFTFSLEPLILTKKHLLSSYDEFIFTFKEREQVDHYKLAFQNILNDVTAINEFCLFPLKNNCDSSMILGDDLAVPISTELLHERNGHSKKNKKNGRVRDVSPLYFYTRTSLKKVEEEYRKINKKDEGEAGLLVEFFIKYKDKDKENKIIKKLKKEHYLGNIIQNVNLFTSRNFKNLKEEINKISINKEENISNKSSNNGNADKNEVIIDSRVSQMAKNKQNLDEKESEEDPVAYYEKNYLFNGYFVYPDSIPIDYVTVIGRKKNKDSIKDKKMLEGKEKYLKKYEKAIIEGRKSHYGKDN